MLDDFVRCNLRDAGSLAQAGDFVVALDGAELHHDVVCADDLSLRIGVLQAFHHHNVGVKPGGDADAQLFAVHADAFEHIGIFLHLQLGICGVCAFAVLIKHIDLFDHAEIGCEDLRLGTDHNSAVTRSGNRNAAALENRPKVGEIAGVGIICLGAVDNQNIQPFFTDKRGSALYSFFEFRNGNLYSLCHNFSSSFFPPDAGDLIFFFAYEKWYARRLVARRSIHCLYFYCLKAPAYPMHLAIYNQKIGEGNLFSMPIHSVPSFMVLPQAKLPQAVMRQNKT